MNWTKINENSVFAVIPDIEAIFAVQRLLTGGPDAEYCQEVFGEDMIAKWKRSYRFLFKSHEAVSKIMGIGLVGLCVDMDLSSFTLESYLQYLLAMPAGKLLYEQLCFGWGKYQNISMDTLTEAIGTDGAFETFYEQIEEDCPDFFGTSSFFTGSARWINEYINLAGEVMNVTFLAELDSYDEALKACQKQVFSGVMEKGGLAFSEMCLSKTFRNRGPYEKFIFLPSVFLTHHCVRLFLLDDELPSSSQKQQILFISLQQSVSSQEDTINALKALSDKSRYQILSLLSKNKPVHGREIARELSLAPSTVSHHMETLKECGLITEEVVRTSKYYGISRQRVKELLDTLNRDFNS